MSNRIRKQNKKSSIVRKNALLRKISLNLIVIPACFSYKDEGLSLYEMSL